MLRTLLAIFCAVQLHAASPWPAGKSYAVSLTYDDGLESQILNAGPALDLRGLKGSFYPTGTSAAVSSNPKAWRALAAKGHELGSHTMRHPCPEAAGKHFQPKELWMESLDRAAYARELDQSLSFLAGLGARRPFTLAWPCGGYHVGVQHEDVTPLAAKRFFAARDAWGGVADLETLSFMHVPAANGGRPLPELMADLEKVRRSGGWLVFMFHGVGGDHLAVDNDAHEALLDALAADPKAWVAPFGTVAGRLIRARKKR